MAGGKKLTKEEELLLQDFSRNVSTKSSALFYGNAFIVSAIPISLKIFETSKLFNMVDKNIPVRGYADALKISKEAGASTTITFYPSLLTHVQEKEVLCRKWLADPIKREAQSSVTTSTLPLMVLHPLLNRLPFFFFFVRVAVKREEAVTREIMKKLADDKKMSKKEKDERILWKKNEVADYEATTFSIFYNNALYLMLITVASFYVMRSFTPSVNYVLSVGTAGGLLALFSTSSH
ncbi:translocon-associated protein subunit gamma-like [Centruroides sculpturatus]|uniref:translocon-associated protein subunit gamma-like n=1 Tax=Centruroides sculpturatus TaxID=218467 RepID=UPI000C6CA6C4|nr:translocon-associated protein subunit gamma-like [Centruroides sculpturatus]